MARFRKVTPEYDETITNAITGSKFIGVYFSSKDSRGNIQIEQSIFKNEQSISCGNQLS